MTKIGPKPQKISIPKASSSKLSQTKSFAHQRPHLESKTQRGNTFQGGLNANVTVKNDKTGTGGEMTSGSTC